MGTSDYLCLYFIVVSCELYKLSGLLAKYNNLKQGVTKLKREKDLLRSLPISAFGISIEQSSEGVNNYCSFIRDLASTM